ncbi:hypothetical protein AAG906_014895 [Vitis piasezkii]
MFFLGASSIACFLINCSPSIAIDKRTSQKVWFGTPASYSNLKIFGCPAYAHVDNGKLEPKSIKCVFLGYESNVKGYNLWYPETKKIILSRDVIFYETTMLHDSSSRDSCDKEQHKSRTQVEFEIRSGSIPKSTSQFSLEMKSDVAAPSPPLAPPQYDEADLVAYALNVAKDIDSSAKPSSHFEAINCDDSSRWMIVMYEKIESLHKNGT